MAKAYGGEARATHQSRRTKKRALQKEQTHQMFPGLAAAEERKPKLFQM